jgi:nucleoside-diphosphate-sugar epimerase
MINANLHKYSRALVIGGAGFIGSHVVDQLVELGVEVAVLDNLSSGKDENLEHHGSKITRFYEDIRDASTVMDIFDVYKPEVVYHLAAIPGVAYSMSNPQETNEVNVQGLLNVLEACRQHKTKKLVFSSSSSIYGGSENLPTSESETPNPKSPYALQKLIGEKYCKLYSRKFGVDTVCLRYFNVFGPRQVGGPYGAVISSFCKAYKEDEHPTIYGDGEQFRDFCYVDNVVWANLLASNPEKNFEGMVINVGCGGRTTVNELSKIIGNKEPVYKPERPGDVKCSQADISRANQELSYYIPKPDDFDRYYGGYVGVTFEEGMRRTIDWWMEQE